MTVNTTGSAFFNIGGDFNAAPGSSGTITLDGGSYYNTYGKVATNFYGSSNANITGTLTLTNSASLVMEPLNPGNGLGFDVGFSGSSGYSATGNLLIEGGSTLEARSTGYVDGSGTITGGYFNINIGRNADAKGYATVTGAGSRMTTEGAAARITVGRNDGYGVLEIEQGGFVGAFNLTVGRDGGVGQINVDGAGSELKTSSAYGFYTGTAQGDATGYNSIGRGVGGKGYLSVTNGGVVNVENEDGISDRAFLRLGRDYGSYGYGLVSGVGSELNITQIGPSDQAAFNFGSDLIVGNSGQAKLIIEQGGSVNVLGDGASVFVADQRGSEPVSSGQSLLEVRSGGSLLVDSQGYAGSFLTVGNDSVDDGRLVISGAGSTVTVQNDLVGSLDNSEFGARIMIGYKGHGELYIDQGGRLIIDGADDPFPQLRIGRGSNGNDQGDVFATGVAIVTGGGSAIDLYSTNTSNTNPQLNGLVSGGSVIVGNRDGAHGELRVLDGGRVSNNGPNTRFGIGDDSGSQGLVIVDGAGSLLEAGESLGISMSGTTDGTPNGTAEPVNGGVGELKITNSGSVDAGDVRVGERGVLDINGGTLTADSLTMWGRLEIGRDTIGTATFGIDQIDFEIGSTWVWDVDGFGAGQADFLTFAGVGTDVEIRSIPIILDLDENLDVSVGDQVALVEFTGGLTLLHDRVVYDQNRGLEFSLEQQGNQLVLVAQEDSTTDITFVGDGTNETIDGGPGNDTLDGQGGDDIINGFAGDDTLLGGPGNDTLNGGVGADNLQGGGGTNTVTYEDAAARVVVDLVNPGTNLGEASGDTFGSIQSVIGSAFDDVIRGSFGANSLFGGDDYDVLFGRAGDDMLFGQNGDDELEGGAGADVLNGGAGSNIASYELSGAVIADLVQAFKNTGDAAGDTYISIQHLIGGAFGDELWGSFGDNQLDGKAGNDFLRGRAGNDTLQGGDGNDQLDGGAGADVIDGDTGINTANYLSSTVGLTIDLNNPLNNTGDAAGDTYFSIQNIQGTFQDDDITGDAQNNFIIGSTGNDILFGLTGDDTLTGQGGNDILVGGAGADTLQGGVGNDIASYQDAASGIFADLILNGLNTGDAAGDTYNAIRGLIGSDHADTLRGTFGSNSIDGGAGNDTILGRGGSDTHTGGAGSDTFIFQNGFGAAETITDFDEFDDNEKIDLSLVANITDFADLTANHLSQNGAHAEITDGAGTIIIQNALVADLNMLDFTF